MLLTRVLRASTLIRARPVLSYHIKSLNRLQTFKPATFSQVHISSRNLSTTNSRFQKDNKDEKDSKNDKKSEEKSDKPEPPESPWDKLTNMQKAGAVLVALLIVPPLLDEALK